MNQIIPFLLEDFFYDYEHRSDLINLASSDALPWTRQDLRKKLGRDFEITGYAYPDVRHKMIPLLKATLGVAESRSVLPVNGAAEGIAIAMHEFALDGKTKSMGIPSPSYGAFCGLGTLLGIEIRTYFYRQECGWTVDVSELMALGRECDAVVVVNPHNPTGARLQDTILQRLANTLASHNGTLLIDEVFRASSEKSILEIVPDSMCDLVAIGSLSKLYGFPGLRFGWLIARDNRISRMRTIQQYLTLSVSAPAVELASEVVVSPQIFSREELIVSNRELLLEWATANKTHVCISSPQGGTTVAIEFPLSQIVSEDKLFEEFVKAGVLLVPGSKLGPSGTTWFRLGYGGESTVLKEGLRRLASVVK